MNDAVFVPERTSATLWAGLQTGAVVFFQNLWGALQKNVASLGRIVLGIKGTHSSQGGVP